MTRRHVLVAVLGLTAAATAALAEDRNPVGERANYELDHSAARTSSMVQEGTMSAVVNGANDGGLTYDVQLDYRFKVRIVGMQTGSEHMPIDNAYFTPEFLEQLRNQGTYVGEKFKVRWLNFEDATTLDGHFYAHCDRILIYDIDAKADLPFALVAQRLLVGAGGGDPHTDASLENMEIKADIFYGVPVLGAVKLDVTGKFLGQNVKAGADYHSP